MYVYIYIGIEDIYNKNICIKYIHAAIHIHTWFKVDASRGLTLHSCHVRVLAAARAGGTSNLYTM